MNRYLFFLALVIGSAASQAAVPASDRSCPATASAWSPLYPKATPGLYGALTTRLGHPSSFLLWALEDQAIIFTSSQKPLGSTQPDLAVEIKDPSGKAVELAVRGTGGNRIFEFTARQTGPYLLSVDPKGHPVIVNSTEAPLCLYAPNEPFQFVGASGNLYFHVPAGVSKFGMKISADGPTKVKATVFDSIGNVIWTQDDINQPSHFSTTRADASHTEVWSLRLETPTHGFCEGNQVILEGLPPLLAASPEALLGRGVAPGGEPPPHIPRILLIGDSMVASYPKPPPDRPTLTGWGQVLNEYMTPGSYIDNRARSGASARSFIEKGYWVNGLIQPLDYVLIHFGGNDQKWGSRYGDPNGSFRSYLRTFILMARARGIKPILVTSVNRREFKDGKIIVAVLPYTEAMKQVGAEDHVPVIDLHERSIALWERIGEKGCEKFSPGNNDHGHVSRLGALELARMVAEDLQNAAPELKPELRLTR